MIALLDQILRSGDRTGAAEEGEVQTHAGTFRNSGGPDEAIDVGRAIV
jgi:hypothetical protein